LPRFGFGRHFIEPVYLSAKDKTGRSLARYLSKYLSKGADARTSGSVAPDGLAPGRRVVYRGDWRVYRTGFCWVKGRGANMCRAVESLVNECRKYNPANGYEWARKSLGPHWFFKLVKTLVEVGTLPESCIHHETSPPDPSWLETPVML